MIQLHKYRIPFKKPFTTAGGIFSHREGIVIEGSKEGIHFRGDAAPLPGFSAETLQGTNDFFTGHLNSFEHLFRQDLSLQEFDEACSRLPASPSARFALSTAWNDYLSQKNKQPPQKIPVNYTLGGGSPEECIEEAVNAWESGYRTVKVKAGLNNAEEEQYVLKAIRGALPDLIIRMDANGAWNVHEAIGYLNRLEAVDIEYCEQPVKFDDINGMAEVRKNTSIPVAADESIRSMEDAERVIQAGAADVLVIKPMFCGSISEFHHMTHLAAEAGLSLTVTTALESGIGRLATARLAAALFSHPHAHGLATGNLLQDDILDDSDRIEDGYYFL